MTAADPSLGRQGQGLTPSTCAIGVITYLGRFETYFKPLIRRLHFFFPDYEINVFLNGHYDAAKQIRYLRECTAFLQGYSQIRYLTNLEHQPIARGFNQLVLMSSRPWALILNDDVFFTAEFRHNLERFQPACGLVTLNGTWSHFLVHKRVMRTVGWFDERFRGGGSEDTDYVIRATLQGVGLENLEIRGLENYLAPPTDAGWANISQIVWDKYSRINWDFFLEKWRPVEDGAAIPPEARRVYAVGRDWWIRPNQELLPLPPLYPYEALETAPGGRVRGMPALRGGISRLLSCGGRLYWTARRFLGPRLRHYLGEKLDYLKRNPQP